MIDQQSGEQPLKVSELLKIIKRQVEGEFNDVDVVGEISNLNHSATGHWYFTLSDQDASMSCCLFRTQALANPAIQKLKEGDQIRLNGTLSVYTKKASVQLIAKKIFLLDEKGKLKEKFEKLKAKLAAEGLFDIDRKKELPAYVHTVAIITSIQGAALQDFLQVMRRRSIEFKIHIYPALVQGDQAAASIIKMLKLAQMHSSYDVVVLARGGGSQEDLWCFNDEQLVRQIASMSIPVISAVGHEVDFTLSDFVADYRCETPTAAAEVLSSKQQKILEQYEFTRKHLKEVGARLKQNLVYKRENLHPASQLQFLQKLFWKRQSAMHQLKPRPDIVQKHFFTKQVQLEQIIEFLSQKTRDLLTEKLNKIQRLGGIIGALDPLGVLKRGYTITSVAGKLVTSKESFQRLGPNDRIEIRFHDGDGLAKKIVEQ